ncbi:MAG TPA: hypothetical protein VKA60_26895 [Blastocatellia bacterium]|nr:hypothetical protein [Blastocatellia bacterium]
MNTSPDRLTARLLRALVATELLLVALYWLDILCGEPPLLNPLFDLDGEANIPAWFSSAQLLLIALTLWTASRFRRPEPLPSRRFLNLLAAGFLLLSLDETAQVHETITGVIGSRYADWVPRLISSHKAFAVLATIGVCWAMKTFYKDARAAWRWSRRECTICLLGVAVVLLGGSLIEAFGYLYLQKGTLAYHVEVSVEEFFEMLGETLILRATLAFVRAACGARPGFVARQNVVDSHLAWQYNRRT